MTKRIVLVAGATGKQGGSVVDSLLRQGAAVRAVTRNPESSKAKALVERGVEVVQGDFTDKASLVEAMKSARAVFFVTDRISAGSSAQKEFQTGKNGIDAALEAGVQHFVWSALEDVRQTPGVMEKIPEVEPGHYVPIFEAKSDVTAYLAKSGLPYTVVLTSIFFDNFLGVYPFIKQEDGSYAFFNNMGHAKLPLHGVAAIGDTVAQVMASPDKYLGKTVPVTAEHVSMDDCATAISKVTGQTMKYVEVPRDAAATTSYPGTAGVANMYQYFKDFNTYTELRPVEGTVVKVQTLSEWVEAKKDALKLMFK